MTWIGSILRVGLLLVGVAGSGSAAPPEACPADLEILVEESLAGERGLEPGDRLAVRGAPEGRECPARIAGVFRPAADPARLAVERPRVLLHLPHLARLAGREGEVDRFSVRLRPGTVPSSVASDISPLLPQARVVRTGEVAERASTTFRVVERFHRAIGGITLVAGGVFLACIMILKVQERRTPVAALRLVGVSGRTLLGWILAEAALVALLGSLLGVGLGRLASAVINHHYRAVYDTTLYFSVVTPEIVVQAAVLGLGFGTAAGVVAGLRLLYVDALAEVGR